MSRLGGKGMKKNIIPLIALFVGFSMIIIAISIDNGSLLLFWSIPSLLITLLGSFCALMVSFPFKYLKAVPALVKQIFLVSSDSRRELIELFSELSRKARREGLLSLEDDILEYEDEFLKRGLQMVVDGIEPETIKGILELEIETTENRHGTGQDIFRAWGELAPAFGMIGTLIGLIIMLSDLEDPSNIGKGMATALITTFYGSIFANLVLIPIANNLQAQTEEELFTREMMIEGILAIQSGINPRIVEEKLMTYLSPQERRQKEEQDAEMVTEYE